MTQILTINDLFNEQFKNSGLSMNFDNLLKFAFESNYIDNATYQFALNNIEEIIKNTILSNLSEEDFEQNIDLIILNKTNELNFYLRSYLKEINDPYQTTSALLQGDFNKILNEAMIYSKDMKKKLIVKYQELNNCSKYITDIFPEYKKFIYTLGLKIDGFEESINSNHYTLMTTCYTTLGGKTLDTIHDLIDVEEMLDISLLELKILSHFNPKDIIRVIKSLNINVLSRNILNCVLYNYVFNSFYSDEPEKLSFSTNMANMISMEIRNGVYSEEEILDIIHNGKIKFMEEEKEYIENTFINDFKTSVIKLKQIDVFVKN